ncbi:unnamed protein product [Effrenium voratum]|uniref:Importin N-terminal domain-containing protein n=1 Tax=Effrenium voratum TaxID=2562239 RepID=A0AA36JL33_9DINO|nr:unnamed protein product [Effrenium voratum]
MFKTLTQLLRAAHTPGPQMAHAAQRLRDAEAEPNFGSALLALLQPGVCEASLAQAAAIYLKNFLRRSFQDVNAREALKEQLVPTALGASGAVRKQLCAAVQELAVQDFPERWPTLLPQLVSAGASRATLELMHAALGQMRLELREASEASSQARCAADAVGPLHLELWRHACRAICESPDGESIELLLAATLVLHDLTKIAMPEHFRQHLDIYMQGVLAVLARPVTSELRQELCSLLCAWLTHHKELLESYVGRTMEAAWTLLTSLDDSPSNDPLVVAGVAVLSCAAIQDWQAPPFKDPKVLAAVCERVVLPNIKLRASDLELFHEDLQEYIARDVEGNDIQTRRWVAIELMRSLRRHHDKEICEIVVSCVGQLLQEANVGDPQRAAICKHACVHLVISMAGSGKSIGPGGLAGEFFKHQLGPELLAVREAPRGTSVEAVLFKAACLKFLTVLRNVLPAKLVLGVVPILPTLMQAEHPLLHTYAAICGNVLTTVQEKVEGASRPRFGREQLGPVLQQMLPTLLRILVEGRSVPQNVHLVRALSSWLTFLGADLPPALATTALQSLAQLASQRPISADYTHGLFECLALALKSCASRQQSTESVVLPMVQQLWVMQADDLLPYCYQIMGLMLDLAPANSVASFYGELLPKLLAPELWQAGLVAGLVRLLRAFFAKVGIFHSLLQQAMPSIFERFQQALRQRPSAGAALGLLCAAFRFLPFELYRSHFQAALAACLAKLETNARELEKDLAVALCIFAQGEAWGGGSAVVLRAAMDQLREGLFEHVLLKVWLPATSRVLTLQRRKVCIFGLIRVMYLPDLSGTAFQACCQALLKLLRLRQFGLPVLIFEELFSGRPLFLCRRHEDINPGDEFQVSFNHLEHAELKEDVWDVLPEIQDVPSAKLAVKAALAPLQQALAQVEGMSQALEDLLKCRERQRRQQRLAKSFCSAASAILETVVQAWVQATQDNRVTRKRQELLREQKLREVDRILRTGIGQGAELYCILQAWHSAVERRQGAFQQRSKAVEAVAQLAVDHLRLAFSGWVSCCKAQRAAQAQRLQSVQKTVAVGLQAGLASIWAAWRQCMDTKRRKQKVEQHMSGLMRSQQEKGLGHFLLLWNMGAVKRKFLKLQAVVLSHRRGRDRALAAIRWLEGRTKQQLAGLFFPWLRQVAGWREKRQAKARYLSLVDCCNLQQQGFWLHAWRGAVREMHHERCRAEMENLKAEHQEQLQRQKEEQIGSRREALKKHFAGSMENLRANSFAAWRDFLIACREEQRLRDAAKQRGELAAQRAAVGLLQSLQAGCFGAWADFQKRQKAESRQNLATSLVQRQLNSSRENFLSLAFGGWLQILKQRGQTARHDAVARRAFARCARASLSQCFAEWRETVRRERLQHLTTELARAKSALRMFENELEQAKERRRCELAGRFMSTSSSMQQQFFQVWKKLVEENIRKAARSAVALRMACKGDQALKVEVFSAWVRQAARERAEQARQRSRQQVLRQLGLSSAGSLSAAVGAWKSFLQARRGAKERLKRGHAIAARRIAELEEPLLALGFAGFRGVVAAARVQQAADARCSHFRSRVVRCDRSFAEKAAAMHNCACLSRSLLLWRLLASVRCAVSFERRKLARTSGLGKATAVRLRHRIHQLRVMWAWLMSSKLKPWERPFLVKPLKEAPLALPMGSPRARSPQVQVFTSRVEPLEAEMDQESAAAAAAAAWVREASRSPSPTRFRVTTSPTRLQQGERYTLASKAATSEGDYRQLLEHNRRQIREQRGAARCSSPEPAGQWGLWAK